MEWYDILYASVFGCLVLALILLKIFKVGNRRRGVVKIIASAQVFVLGIFGAAKGGYAVIAAIGLGFAALGDILLVFMDKRKYFICGVLSFGVAGLLLTVYSIVNYGWVWWSIIPFVIFVVGNSLLQKLKVLDYGSTYSYINIYILLVTACGMTGFALMCSNAQLPAILFGAGCFMYYASDICLGLYMFRYRFRAVDAINTLLYFPGMFLVALSLVL